jgi:hypothetical protein
MAQHSIIRAQSIMDYAASVLVTWEHWAQLGQVVTDCSKHGYGKSHVYDISNQSLA